LDIKERTVLDWLIEAGISEARAFDHIREGGVVVDGLVVTDPDGPVEVPSQVRIRFIRR
jgi:hypothetical protein